MPPGPSSGLRHRRSKLLKSGYGPDKYTIRARVPGGKVLPQILDRGVPRRFLNPNLFKDYESEN